MEYSKLSNDQRGKLLEMIGQLQGLIASARSEAKREGILDLGYITANRDVQNILSVELERLVASYPKPEVS